MAHSGETLAGAGALARQLEQRSIGQIVIQPPEVIEAHLRARTGAQSVAVRRVPQNSVPNAMVRNAPQLLFNCSQCVTRIADALEIQRQRKQAREAADGT